MKKLVFICKGNMFRSPIAEGLFNATPVEGWKAFSYGTTVELDGHQNKELGTYGAGIGRVIEKMKTMDIDISKKKSTQVEQEHIMNADKIIVMSEKEYIPTWLHFYAYEYWEIPNPDIISDEDIENVIKLLSEKIVHLKKDISHI